MDSEIKAAIYSEIDHSVLDSDEKFNINQISENWDLSLKQSSDLLEEWCKTQKNVDFKKEHIVRGVDKNGNARITIVDEGKLERVRDAFEKFCSSLFAVEKSAETKSSNIYKLSEGKRISLHLDCKIRTVDDLITESDVTEEAGESKSNQQKAGPSKKLSPKKEQVTPRKQLNTSGSNDNKKSIASMFSNVKPKKESPPTPSAKIQTQNVSPKKELNNKTSPSKRKLNGSAVKPSKMSKVSIASFFGTVKPKQSTIEVDPEEDSKQITPKEEPSEKSSEQEMVDIQEIEELAEKLSKDKVEKDNSRKRSITNESDDTINSSQIEVLNPSKRLKARDKKKMHKKGNRIMQMSDSSDEEEKENSQKMKEEEKVDVDEVKVDKSIEIKSPKITKKAKAKRVVTRTYEDENGYLTTQKEIEEYSCSEEEKVEEVDRPKAAPPKPSPKKPVKKVPQKTATKQGSIMSFFAKKN